MSRYSSPPGARPADAAAGAAVVPTGLPPYYASAHPSHYPGGTVAAFDPLRVAGSSLSLLIEKATAAAADHETALRATSEAAAGWQQRASAAETEATQLNAARSSLQMSLTQSEQDKTTALARVAALEQQVQALQRSSQGQLQRERDAEARCLELEAQLSGKVSELRAVQQSHALCHQQKIAVDEELQRCRQRLQADGDVHAQEQTSLRMRLEAERDQQLQSLHEVQARLHEELQTARNEHSRKVQIEVDANAKLREEIRVCRQEVERVNELRRRELAEHEHKVNHSTELHRASITRMESQMAATASTAALELERAKKGFMEEMAVVQETVTEAKAESATAMQHALEAREDALRWQRAMERPALPTSALPTSTTPGLGGGTSSHLASHLPSHGASHVPSRATSPPSATAFPSARMDDAYMRGQYSLPLYGSG